MRVAFKIQAVFVAAVLFSVPAWGMNAVLPIDSLSKASQQTINLRGCASTSEPLANASVSLKTSLGVELKTEADGGGCFQFDYSPVADHEIVAIHVQGKGNLMPLEMASYIGDAALIKEKAGSDGALTQQEWSFLRINPLNTAFYLVMNAVPESHLAKKEDRFKTMYFGADLSDVYALVAPLSQEVSRDDPGLAEGQTTLDYLMREQSTFGLFTRSLYSDLYYKQTLDCDDASLSDKLKAACLSVHNIYSSGQNKYVSADVAGKFFSYLYHSANFFYLYADVLHFDSDQKGELFEKGNKSSNPVLIDWRYEDSEKYHDIKRSDGRYFLKKGKDYIDESCDCQKRGTAYKTSKLIRFVQGYYGYYLIEGGRYELKDTADEKVVREYLEPAERFAFVRERNEDYFSFSDLSNQQWMLPRCYNNDCSLENEQSSGYSRVQYYDEHHFFHDGRGEASIKKEGFSWSVSDDGVLNLTYDSGLTVDYHISGYYFDSANVVFHHGSSKEGLIGSFGKAVPINRFYSFASNHVRDGMLYSSISCNSKYKYLQYLYNFCDKGGFGFSFSSSGAGFVNSSDPNFTGMSWEVTGDENIVISRFKSDGGVYQRRLWTLISENESGVYVLEHYGSPRFPNREFDKNSPTSRLIFYRYRNPRKRLQDISIP